MNHGSLFSGIGGIDLAAERMGWKNVFSCEINDFGNKILNYYWPNTIHYEDINKTDFTIHRGTIDILTGGFPCQPFSQAGKRKGTEDDRHLWPRMLEVIREVQPRWVVGENVSGIVNWDGGLVFDQVQTDLENEGYEVLPVILPACAVNAPHRRDRVWFIAHSISAGAGNKSGELSDKGRKTSKDRREGIQQENRKTSAGWGNTTDTNGDITDTSNTRIEGMRSERENSIHESESTPNSKSNGDRRELQRVESKDGSKRESKEHRKNNLQFGNNVKVGNATNTGNQGLQGGKLNGTPNQGGKECKRQDKGQPYEPASKLYKATNWGNFPTQSPICSGDDELPGRLDGITFPKWRNESIKAYGNAVVPELVYEIFKIIQEMDEKY